MPTPRYSSRVSTRVTGAQVSAANDNAVEDRVLALAADVAYMRAVSAAAWQVQDGADAADRAISGSGGYVTNQAAGASVLTLEAPIDLPHDYGLTELTLYGSIFSNSSAYVTVRLFRVAHADGTTTQIGSDCTITGSVGNLSTSVVLAEDVDTALYSYKLRATLYNASDANQARLYSATVL